jgi:hypothetical protein
MKNQGKCVSARRRRFQFVEGCSISGIACWGIQFSKTQTARAATGSALP